MPSTTQLPYRLSVAALSDVGRQRDHNEDSIGYRVPDETEVLQEYGALFVVCDGVGGGTAGEEASEVAVSHILSEYYQAPSKDAPNTRLTNAIREADAQIDERNAQLRAGRMATTVVAAIVRGSQLWLAHAGDSRIYLIRDGHITQLTEDHSWVAHMVRAGQLTPEEARQHPWRNHITRALGQEGQIDVDSNLVTLNPGDTILLCTDGLTEYLPDAEMAQLATDLPVDDAAQQLIDLANKRGGHDNISAILVTLAAIPPNETLVTMKKESEASARQSVSRPLAIVGCLVLLAAAAALAGGMALARLTPGSLAEQLAAMVAPSPTPFPTVTALPTSTAIPPTLTTLPPGSTLTPAPTPSAVATVTLTLPPTPSPTAPEPTPGQNSFRPADGMEMIYIPAGAFSMGNADQQDESPPHQVNLDAFWIDRTEITNREYAQFLNAIANQLSSCQPLTACVSSMEENADSHLASKAGRIVAEVGFEDHPATHVTWLGAATYCQWADARLPTEAEWEKAARGSSGRRYPWGDSFEAANTNFCDRSCTFDAGRDEEADDNWATTAPVGSFPDGASPYAVYDLAGNVWEWVSDWYGHDYYQQSPGQNPSGPQDGQQRVVRGGSWFSAASDLRAANRSAWPPDTTTGFIGFRCARSE